MVTVRINGVDVPVDQISGPSGDELFRAQRRHNGERMRSFHEQRNIQGSGSRFIGTPRHAKHTGDCSAYGVRVK